MQDSSQIAAPGAGSHPFFQGFKAGLPISLGYFVVSFTVGIVARNIGFHPLQAGLMSFLMHASAGEFAALNVIATGGSYLTMVITSVVVNIRYVLMACSLSQRLAPQTPLYRRAALSYFVTDELFGLACTQPVPLSTSYYFGTAAAASPGWVLGTICGAAISAGLPPALTSALSVALYAMFIAVVVPASKAFRPVAFVVAASMAASFLCSVLPYVRQIDSNFRVITLTIVISAVAALVHPVHVLDKTEPAVKEESSHG